MSDTSNDTQTTDTQTTDTQTTPPASTDPAPDASVGGPARHFPTRERNRNNPDSALPPNPNADTAYGPVRGQDPAHPDASA